MCELHGNSGQKIVVHLFRAECCVKLGLKGRPVPVASKLIKMNAAASMNCAVKGAMPEIFSEEGNA